MLRALSLKSIESPSRKGCPNDGVVDGGLVLAGDLHDAGDVFVLLKVILPGEAQALVQFLDRLAILFLLNLPGRLLNRIGD